MYMSEPSFTCHIVHSGRCYCLLVIIIILDQCLPEEVAIPLSQIIIAACDTFTQTRHKVRMYTCSESCN